MNDGELRATAVDRPVHTGLRTLIALTMLLIASLGAGVAGWAAIKQQASTALERRLSQAQTMELAERLPLIDFSRSAHSLQERLDRHRSEEHLQRALADAARSGDPARARIHDLAAQEARLKANVLMPFVEYLPNIINPDQLLDERRIGLVAAGSLQRRGFQAQWIEGADASSAEPAAPSTAHIAYLEKDRLEAFDEQVLQLAMVVVALVVTLVLLTLADLSSRRRALAAGLYFLAIIGAALCIGAAVHIDEGLIRIIAGIAGAFAALVGVAWMLGWLGRRAEVDEPLQTQGIDQGGGFAGASLQVVEAGNAFSRHLVVWIALAALVSAVIGYWYTVAGSRGDDAAYGAYQQQLEVARRSGRGTTAVISTFEALANLYENRLACQAATSRTEPATSAGSTPAASGAPVTELDRKLHCDALTAGEPTAAATTLSALDHNYGPDADPRFPARLQQQVTGATPDANTSEALALWDGYAEIEAFWNGKTTSFLACLTIIAIALYVLGQALAMAGLGVARAMAICGITMTLGALGWSAFTWTRPMAAQAASSAPSGCALPKSLEGAAGNWSPEGRMQAAAHNYAIGALRLGAADAEADFDAAISALECAVAFRPTLGLAYNDLAGAKALSQSAHRAQAYYSLPTKDRLDEIERNARAFIDIQQGLGLAPNAYALNTHAVALWGLGIRDRRLAPITEALTIVERAINVAEPLEFDRQKVSSDAQKNLYPWLSILPILHVNHSLFLIANDRLDAARAASERALALGASRDWSLASAMLTATWLLDSACEGMHSKDRCEAIREALAKYRKALLDGDWPDETARPSGRLQSVGIAATPSTVSAAIRLPTFDPAKDHVQMIWSVVDPQWNVRDVLSNVTPAVQASEMQIVKDRGVYVQRRIMQAGNFRRCLSPGRYTAEIYLNGRLETTATTEFKGPQLAASRLDRLNLAFCHPKGWTLWTPIETAGWDPTPMVGFVNSAGKPVAYLFSFMMPKAITADADNSSNQALDRALQFLSRRQANGATIDGLKARLKPCNQAQPGDIARAVARGASGLVHVALLDVDALEGVGACLVMNTVTMMN
ncbi:MAG: hypothetical protein AB7E81_16470 [Hyphomicrobiaceae bacterium]